MKYLKIAVLAVLFAASNLFAQEATQEVKVPDFNLTFNAANTKVVFIALQEIDLKGKEAGAYMTIQEQFQPHLEKIVNKELADDDSYSITLPANVANALYVFVNRCNVTALNAERLIEFKKEIEREAKRITDSMPKKAE